jgi:hypothetical protein
LTNNQAQLAKNKKQTDHACGRFFSWKKLAKKIKMSIDNCAQIMYNDYNGGVWCVFNKNTQDKRL